MEEKGVAHRPMSRFPGLLALALAWAAYGLLCAPAGASAQPAVLETLAQPPVVETLPALATGPSTELLQGTVEDAGEGVAYHFDYATAEESWCQSRGLLGQPLARTPSTPLGGEEAEARLTGLQPGEGYCAELVAVQDGEPAHGEPVYFTAGAPTLGPADGEALSEGTEALRAQANFAGAPSEEQLQYATASSSWCTSWGEAAGYEAETAPSAPTAEEVADGYARVEVSGLLPGTGYCARLVLSNQAALVSGPLIRFVAGAPSATTEAARPEGVSTELLGGEIMTAGQSSSYFADYAPASSAWCRGGEGAPGEVLSSPAAEAPSSSPAGQRVSVKLAGLQSGASYCALLIARNVTAESERVGSPLRFTAGAPDLESSEVVSVSGEEAQLSATFRPAGPSAEVQVAYAGADTRACWGAGGARVTSTSSATPAGEGSVTVAIGLTGLQPGVEYCADVTALNEFGRSETERLTFIAGAPTTRSLAVAPAGTGALFTGEVDGAGAPTSYLVRYSPASSRWCTSQGSIGEPRFSSPPSPLDFSDGGFHAVQVLLPGLASGAYCGVLQARNPRGESPPSRQLAFTAPRPPHAATTAVSPTGEAAARLEGEVDPSGQQTAYLAEYALASSTWCSSEGAEGAPEHTTAPVTLPAQDDSAHAVALEFGGLAAGSEYCARVAASNGAGAADAGAPVRFKTPGSSSPAPSNQGSQQESGTQTGRSEVLGSQTSTPLPQLGTQASVGTVSGTATVKLKGGVAFVALSAGQLLPDGSEIEAANGVVAVTVALPEGRTQTAQVGGGRFRIEQERDGLARFVLTLPLSGCPRTKLPKGSASAAGILRTQPLTRHLRVGEKGGRWGTTGRYVSTTVEGTEWSTTDDCARSIVKVYSGRVKVRNLLTRTSRVVRAGHAYTATVARRRRRR